MKLVFLLFLMDGRAGSGGARGREVMFVYHKVGCVGLCMSINASNCIYVFMYLSIKYKLFIYLFSVGYGSLF